MGIPLGVLPAAGSAVSGEQNLGTAYGNIVGAANNLFGGGSGNSFPAPIRITLTLGSFVFQDMEVPEVIPFHAAQRLSVKKMIGGVRQIDAMGQDYAPITIRGTIWPYKTLSALDRAKQLALMRDQALPLVLTWDTLRFRVLVSDFNPDYRFARIPYSLSLEVLEDLTQPASGITNPDIDTVAANAISGANSILSMIAQIENLTAALVSGYAALGELISAMSLAIYAVSSNVSNASSASPSWSTTSSTAATAGTAPAATTTSLVGATPSVINPVIQTVVAAINGAQSVSSTADAVIASAPGTAGVVAGQLGAASAAALNSVLAAHQMQVQVLELTATLQVLLANLQQINGSMRTITVSGGNLYQVAALEYGDSTAADLIMEANGLIDPQLSGNVTLVIPPYNAATANGGILSV